MSRTLIRRLERLEQQGSSAFDKTYTMFSEPDEPDDAWSARIEAFKATLPDYDGKRDMLLCIHFVSPEFVRARQEAA